jgi:hypothetical protein
MKPENIVRLNFYTTDVDGFMEKAGELVPIFVTRSRARNFDPRRGQGSEDR